MRPEGTAVVPIPAQSDKRKYVFQDGEMFIPGKVRMGSVILVAVTTVQIAAIRDMPLEEHSFRNVEGSALVLSHWLLVARNRIKVRKFPFAFNLSAGSAACPRFVGSQIFKAFSQPDFYNGLPCNTNSTGFFIH